MSQTLICKLCTKYGCVLVFDEVITGFRKGLGRAQKVLDVTPDITILGKILGRGELPVSAVVDKKDIMKLYEEQLVIYRGIFNGSFIMDSGSGFLSFFSKG